MKPSEAEGFDPLVCPFGAASTELRFPYSTLPGKAGWYGSNPTLDALKLYLESRRLDPCMSTLVISYGL